MRFIGTLNPTSHSADQSLIHLPNEVVTLATAIVDKQHLLELTRAEVSQN